jgi:hypothetical protein
LVVLLDSWNVEGLQAAPACLQSAILASETMATALSSCTQLVFATRLSGLWYQAQLNGKYMAIHSTDAAQDHHIRACNTTRQRQFQDLHGQPVITSKGHRFRRLGFQLLNRASDVFKALGIPFWLSSGTLLGWYRQCDFLDYSGDVDVGMFAEDYQPDMLGPLRAAGLVLTHRFGQVDDGFELSFGYTEEGHELKLDVFFIYRAVGHFWNAGTDAFNGQKYRYSDVPFTLCWAEFEELVVQVPCETEEYLRTNYGANWFTPVTHWDWKTSPPNVALAGRWDPILWPQVIQCPVCPTKVDPSAVQV